jgi:peptide/nickel transport system permease protein
MSPLFENRKAAAGLAILGFFVLVALLGPIFVGDIALDTGVAPAPPSFDHWFGTTAGGNDVLAQTVIGARATLGVSFLVGAGVILIGSLIGTAAGYLGGWVDDALSLVTNVFLVMPGLPLIVVIAAYLPPGPVTIAIVLTLTSWAWSARVVRAQTLSLRGKDFVSAALVGGESRLRIVVYELLPNMSSLIVSAFIGATVYAMGAAVGLEFLGLGDSSVISWGTNLYWARNDLALMTGAWWTFAPSGLCIALVGFALALVNFGIDEITNPRLASAAKGKGRALISEATPVVMATHADSDARAPKTEGEVVHG